MTSVKLYIFLVPIIDQPLTELL